MKRHTCRRLQKNRNKEKRWQALRQSSKRLISTRHRIQQTSRINFLTRLRLLIKSTLVASVCLLGLSGVTNSRSINFQLEFKARRLERFGKTQTWSKPHLNPQLQFKEVWTLQAPKSCSSTLTASKTIVQTSYSEAWSANLSILKTRTGKNHWKNLRGSIKIHMWPFQLIITSVWKTYKQSLSCQQTLTRKNSLLSIKITWI